MRILKTHVLLRLLNSYVVDSPEPANISYLWNFGSLLAVCLIIQILTGAFLAMHFTPNIDFAFNSVEHIMRDVNNGWLIRYTHANVASFFFIFVYARDCKFIISNKLFFSKLTFAKAACNFLDWFLSITRKHLPLIGKLTLFCYCLSKKAISDIFFEQQIFSPLLNKFRLNDLVSKDMDIKNNKNPKNKKLELDTE